jgi:2-dehydro-3-deoxyphosphogalactonate aldolase
LNWTDAVDELPLIAIVRGIEPAQAVSVAEVLFESGFRIVEVPLNSPQPFASIEAMRNALQGRAIVGAGTVLTINQVRDAHAAGAELIVAPNTSPTVIRTARDFGQTVLPGFFTPSEAFTALDAGADGLKLFPAEALGPAGLKGVLAVLPRGTQVFPVGGIEPTTMGRYRSAGAAGFGIGSSLFRPGSSVDEIRAAAGAFVQAWRAAP